MLFALKKCAVLFNFTINKQLLYRYNNLIDKNCFLDNTNNQLLTKDKCLIRGVVMKASKLLILLLTAISAGTLTSCAKDDISSVANNLQSQIDELKADVASLKAQIHNLEEEMTISILSLENEYGEMITVTNDKIHYLEQTLIDLDSDFQAQLKALEEDYKTTTDALIDGANEELQKVKDDYDSRINELTASYNAKVTEIEEEIAAANSSIDALRSEMNAAITSIQNDYNGKINALTTRVANLENVTYHTVTFDTLGGSTISPAIVIHGEKVNKPVDPTKSGCSFNGWLYQGEPWVFFGYVITEDITLTADWVL